jgi:RNA polymerase sigma-70 factor (ECF subfamily)
MEKNRQNLSQNIRDRCFTYVDAQSEAVILMDANGGDDDLEAVFRAQYERIARVIAGVIRDHARAEELAVEVFLKWDRHPATREKEAGGWLYRTAIRMALNEMRHALRRSRYEAVFAFLSFHTARRAPSPEQIRAAKEEQEQVRVVLNRLKRRDAELLLLRNSGLTYNEIAGTLHLNPSSIGTLLNRAEEAFRKEFIKLYGK